MEEGTRGTETSKYPEEKKETSISKVAASEMERAQTGSLLPGLRTLKRLIICNRRCLESHTEEGKGPVGETEEKFEWIQSTTGHVLPGGKQGGPPPKAKYYLLTDREEYREGKVKRTPGGE